MKGKQLIRMSILLSFFILAIGGSEVKCINHGENTTRVLMNQQVNKTIMVRTCIHLTFYGSHESILISGDYESEETSE